MARCGDGVVGPGEGCDDGNEDPTDACANCRTPNGLPMLGAVRPGLHVATGGNGLAAKSSDEIGRLAACAALSPSGWDPGETHELLAAERFAPRLKDGL